MYGKLEQLKKRYEEIQAAIQDPKIIADRNRYSSLLREAGRISKVVDKYIGLLDVQKKINEVQDLILHEGDKELLELAKSELYDLRLKEESFLSGLADLLAFEEGEDQKNIIMEIRAGTGGEEACQFAADLFWMYIKFAEKMHWKAETLYSSPTELNGFKEIVFSLSGAGVFKHMKYESGCHRVQRVPITESSGRIHTSAVTVAVLPEAGEVEVSIDPSDIRIDTFRSSGPGGQSVNKTSSAVRITHIPTGMVVSCQDEKSQHKNRSKAMRILRSRLYDKMKEEKKSMLDETRRGLIGSGDRSERIRTYNFPQNRVTDHRVNLNLYDLQNVLLGDMDGIIKELMRHHKEEKLRNLK